MRRDASNACPVLLLVLSHPMHRKSRSLLNSHPLTAPTEFPLHLLHVSLAGHFKDQVSYLLLNVGRSLEATTRSADRAMLRSPVQAPVRVPSPSAPPSPGFMQQQQHQSQYGVRHPVQSTPGQYAGGPLGPGAFPGQQRPRAASNMDSNAGVMYATPRPGIPPGPQRGMPPGQGMMSPPPPRTPSAASTRFPQQLQIPIGGIIPSQSVSPVSPPTDIGGTAGMAGVGRRGFAAAARVALFAHQMGNMTSPTESLRSPLTSPQDQIPGMDGRRPNAPRYLNIVPAADYGASSQC